jgi:hypothetical protein
MDNIKMNLKEIGCEVEGWVEQTDVTDRWRALAYTAINPLATVVNC